MRRCCVLMLSCALLAACAVPAAATSITPGMSVPQVKVQDTPDDAGGRLTVHWDEPAPAGPQTRFRVMVASQPGGPYHPAVAADADAGTASPAWLAPYALGPGDGGGSVVIEGFLPAGGGPVQLADGTLYHVRVDVVRGDVVEASSGASAATPRGNWFNRRKLNNLVLAAGLSLAILAFLRLAHVRELYIRRIPGLEAMDEALGRATEMGRPVLFVHGLREMKEISTIAAVSILGRVARRTAEYDTMLRVTNFDPVVMSVSQETVRASYLEAGRPDAYNPDNIFVAGTDQFSYAAAVEGIMVRERPAAHIMVGFFYAESLLLAETGASTGAIQIAGTDSFTQLPFFVTTCDYTLLGEELYAASAYLSREPRLLGSLKGQDVGKGVLIVVLVVGTLLATVGMPEIARLFHAY